ncbi:hypothetical protein LTR84_006517 [Exophiala bonariae]|uniref:Amino acid permease/ SLC12A domain-containing protein n=1 Tax=Exophiala bonariae TaxID=1690606 RepID=A0AAV9N0B8_9EURO|nr:hypothetical protein LTR84_006517 [Exophiala bonariae]
MSNHDIFRGEDTQVQSPSNYQNVGSNDSPIYNNAASDQCQCPKRPPRLRPNITRDDHNVATSNYTHHFCIAGLILSTIIGIALTVAGSLDRRQDRLLHKPYVFKELVPLGLNLIVVVCTESLGYIHAKTQQWSLWEEDRLEFNTNIRLLSYARKSWANGITLSTANLLALTMSYTSTSAILLSEAQEHDTTKGKMVELSFSRTGPICLGISLLVQATICFVGLRTTKIKTWSSHPLVVATIVRDHGLESARNGHNLHLSSHHQQISGLYSSLKQPASQPSAFEFHRSIRILLWALGLTLLVLIIWMSVVVRYALTADSGSSWALLPIRSGDIKSSSPWVILTFFNRIPGREMRVLAQIALTMVIQLFVTIGLHSSELAVLLSRDEDAWRAASTSHGTDTRSTSFLTVLKSWQSLILLFAKPVIHWIYGLAMYITYDGLVMIAPQLVYLIGLWLLLIFFVLFLSFKRPRGLQPAAYGHLPTLVEFLDECHHDATGRLFWSPKFDPAYHNDSVSACFRSPVAEGPNMMVSSESLGIFGYERLRMPQSFRKLSNTRRESYADF